MENLTLEVIDSVQRKENRQVSAKIEWDLPDAYQQPNAIQKIKPAAHSRLVCMTYSLTTRNTTAKFYHEYAASIEFNENNETDQKNYFCSR